MYSPYISEEVAEKIERECVRREGVDLRTGEIIYRFTTGALKGSYDSRVRINIERRKWVKGERDAVPVCIETEPFLYIEGSVHKLLLGHNIKGGPENFKEAAFYFIDLIQDEIGVELPDRDFWQVTRVDYAEIFFLGNEAVQAFMRSINMSVYPRRKVVRYGCESIFAPGITTALRMYHKGPEFYKHDRKRLKKFLSDEVMYDLAVTADQILRVEVEIKKRKLRYDFSGYDPFIEDITDEYLYTIYKKEVERLLFESKIEVARVRKVDDVEKRLYKNYSASLASILLGTWYRLSIKGEEQVKKQMADSTFRRHKKYLVEAGVSWLGTDVAIVENDMESLPIDFKPLRNDIRCLRGEAPEVCEKLKKYRKAA